MPRASATTPKRAPSPNAQKRKMETMPVTIEPTADPLDGIRT